MKKSPPVVLIGGLILVTIGLVQLGYTILQARDFSVASPVPKVAEENEKPTSVSKAERPSGPFDIVKDSVDVFLHNPSQGAVRSRVTLTVFTDPLCDRCRREIHDVLAQIGSDREKVRVVYKFKPQDDTMLDGGIFEQIAMRQGVYEAYQQELSRQSQRLTVADLVSILERSGLSLDKVRAAMAVHTASTLEVLQKDIDQAKELGVVRIPAFYLNGYDLDQSGLSINRIGEYVTYLLEGGGDLSRFVQP